MSRQFLAVFHKQASGSAFESNIIAHKLGSRKYLGLCLFISVVEIDLIFLLGIETLKANGSHGIGRIVSAEDKDAALALLGDIILIGAPGIGIVTVVYKTVEVA